MSEEDNEAILRIIIDYNADIESQISKDWKCIICKRMLIKAYSGPCGCRYCWNCIINYLDHSIKCCPGSLNDCRKQSLDINHNILFEQTVNIQILNIVVKCPEQYCPFKDKLRNMKSHMRLCTSRSDKCPYSHIGCSSLSMPNDQINDHLQEHNQLHAQLILEWVDNLTNEMGAMKRNCRMTELETESTATNAKITQLEQTLRDVQAQLAVLGGELQIKQEKIVELENHKTLQTRDISLLKSQMRQSDKKLAVMERLLRENRNEMTQLPWKYLRIGVIIVIVIAVYMKINGLGNGQFALQRQLDNIERKHGNFEWKIENFTTHRENAIKGIVTSIHSKPFFTHENGYAMSLQLFPNGDKYIEDEYLSIYFTIMRGPFDELLPWPMDHEVVMELINQQTGSPHISRTVESNQYTPQNDLRKPKSDRNNGIGFFRFIKLTELLEIEGLINNDGLVIRCTIN